MRAKKHISKLTASVLALTLLSAYGEKLADAETEDYQVSDVAAETEPASTLNAEADVAGAMDTALELAALTWLPLSILLMTQSKRRI